jgi:hypothetical protein
MLRELIIRNRLREGVRGGVQTPRLKFRLVIVLSPTQIAWHYLVIAGQYQSLGLQPQCSIPRIARRMTRDSNIAVISQISIASKRRQYALPYGPIEREESPNAGCLQLFIPLPLSTAIFQRGRRPMLATFSPCITAAQHPKARVDKAPRVVGINHIPAGVRARTFSFSPPESLVDMTLIPDLIANAMNLNLQIPTTERSMEVEAR